MAAVAQEAAQREVPLTHGMQMLMLALEKARVVQFFYWLEKIDEADASTWSIPSVSGFMNMVQGKKTPRLKMKKLSAPALLAKWELGPSTVNMLVRGMALHAGALALKQMALCHGHMFDLLSIAAYQLQQAAAL